MSDSDWWPISVGGRRLVVLGPYRDAGVVAAMSAEHQLAWCRENGGRLPEAEEFDAIWRQADVRVPPNPRNVVTAPLDSLSEDVAAALGDGVTQRIACGKTWIQHARMTDARAVNYGWHVPGAEVRGGSWRGIRVHPAATSGDLYVIQPPGAVHSWSHVDYSQAGYCVRDDPDTTRRETPPTPTSEGESSVRVRRWQQWLNAHDTSSPPIAEDGNHGTRTTAKAASYWRSVGLEEVSEARIVDSNPGDTEPAPLLPPIRFVAGATYQHGRTESPSLVVIHTAECAEVAIAAENLQAWAARPPSQGGPRASWHYAVDSDSITRTVAEADRAWAVGAGPAHERGIQIELAGRASQSPAEWSDAYSLATLDLAARLTADICSRHDIPVTRLGPTELRAGDRGICGHVDVSDAWRRTTHRDPGIHFPWAWWLAEVWRYRFG